VPEGAPGARARRQAQILFDRFHIVKHLNEAVDAVHRELWRQLTAKESVTFKATRRLLLKNPCNLTGDSAPTTAKKPFNCSSFLRLIPNCEIAAPASPPRHQVHRDLRH
jgi:transposase